MVLSTCVVPIGDRYFSTLDEKEWKVEARPMLFANSKNIWPKHLLREFFKGNKIVNLTICTCLGMSWDELW